MADKDPKERARYAGLDTSKLSDEQLEALGRLSDEELRQLAQIKKKTDTTTAAPQSIVDGGVVF